MSEQQKNYAELQVHYGLPEGASVFKDSQALPLENGEELSSVEMAYHTYGKLNAEGNNVVWVFHALTANSDPEDWWEGIFKESLNPEKHFIVCANILGSCYGSSGPVSIKPESDAPYFLDFPLVTIRDITAAHQRLCHSLGIKKIKLGIGGSMGGQQLLEWAIAEPDFFEHIIPIATNAFHSPWGIAFNEAQRMALLADPTFFLREQSAGQSGMAAARATALLSYRHYEAYRQTQSEENAKLNHYKAASYQRYQGEKLVKRFHAHAYYVLSKAMDSHDVGRYRESREKALERITAITSVVSISSDVLFPPVEQEYLAKHIPGAKYYNIDSDYGHDGFLLEFKQLNNIISETLSPKV